MHEHHHLRRPKRPALLEHDVVDILHPDSGVLAKNVERIQYFLEIYQPDFPLPTLLLNYGFERVRRRPVSPARIEENEV